MTLPATLASAVTGSLDARAEPVCDALNSEAGVCRDSMAKTVAPRWQSVTNRWHPPPAGGRHQGATTPVTPSCDSCVTNLRQSAAANADEEGRGSLCSPRGGAPPAAGEDASCAGKAEQSRTSRNASQDPQTGHSRPSFAAVVSASPRARAPLGSANLLGREVGR